jgi:hypothetical protein
VEFNAVWREKQDDNGHYEHGNVNKEQSCVDLLRRKPLLVDYSLDGLLHVELHVIVVSHHHGRHFGLVEPVVYLPFFRLLDFGSDDHHPEVDEGVLDFELLFYLLALVLVSLDYPVGQLLLYVVGIDKAFHEDVLSLDV